MALVEAAVDPSAAKISGFGGLWSGTGFPGRKECLPNCADWVCRNRYPEHIKRVELDLEFPVHDLQFAIDQYSNIDMAI